MKKIKLRSLDDPQFKTLEKEMLMKLVGGFNQETTASIRTFDTNCNCEKMDTLSEEDAPTTTFRTA